MSDEITPGIVGIFNGNALALQGREISNTPPTSNQTLIWNDTLKQWVPTTSSGGVAWGGITGALGDQTDLNTALGGKEVTTNKSTSVTTDGASDTKYPSAKAVKTYADTKGVVDGQQIFDGSHLLSFDSDNRQLIANDGSTVALDWSDPTQLVLGVGGPDVTIHYGDHTEFVSPVTFGSSIVVTGLSGVDPLVTGGLFVSNGLVVVSGFGGFPTLSLTCVTDGSNAPTGGIGEYISASVVQASATALTTATPKTVTSISLTAGDWDVTAIGALTAASTGTQFDVAISANTNSFTGTVLGDTRCETPTVSLTGADATLMIPAVRISISGTTTYYLVVSETFTIGSPKAYGRISARRVR